MKIKHILRPREFVSVITSGKRLARGKISLFIKQCSASKGISVGVVVSKKNEPLATKRNYIRRTIYSFFTTSRIDPGKGIDLVVRVNGSTRDLPRKQLGKEIHGTLEQLVALSGELLEKSGNKNNKSV